MFLKKKQLDFKVKKCSVYAQKLTAKVLRVIVETHQQVFLTRLQNNDSTLVKKCQGVNAMGNNVPQMMTIRQIAATGLLPEHAMRQMEKQGKLPCIYSGRKCLVNYTRLLEQLNDLGCSAK